MAALIAALILAFGSEPAPLFEEPIVEIELLVLGPPGTTVADFAGRLASAGFEITWQGDDLARVRRRGWPAAALAELDRHALRWPYDVDVRRPDESPVAVLWTGQLRAGAGFVDMEITDSRCIPLPRPPGRAALIDRRTGAEIGGDLRRDALRFRAVPPALVAATSGGLLDVITLRLVTP
jgi:hypothetical protein